MYVRTYLSTYIVSGMSQDMMSSLPKDESNRLRHKWSKIAYEDPLTTSYQGLDGCPVQQATNDTRKDFNHIHIEPVGIAGFNGYEFVCPKDAKDEEDGDMATMSDFSVRTGVDDDTLQEVVPRAEGDPVLIPNEMKQSIEGYRERYRQYQRRTCTQAVGDFDPATIIERLVVGHVQCMYIVCGVF